MAVTLSRKSPAVVSHLAKNGDGEVRKNANAANAGILAVLSPVRGRPAFVSRNTIVDAVGKLIPEDVAVQTYIERYQPFGEGRANKPTSFKVTKGREYKVMLLCIALKQRGLVEQRGRGDAAEFKLASKPATDTK